MRRLLLALMVIIASFSQTYAKVVIDYSNTIIDRVNIKVQLYQHYASRADQMAYQSDSVAIVDGTLALDFDFSKPYRVYIEPANEAHYEHCGYIELLIWDSDNISVKAYDHECYITTTVTGSQFNAVLSEYNNLRRHMEMGEERYYEIRDQFILSHEPSPALAYILLSVHDPARARELCSGVDKSCFVAPFDIVPAILGL